MTLERAREIIAQQLQFGGGYNRNAVRLLLGEVQREHGQGAADGLFGELDLEARFGLKPGTVSRGSGAEQARFAGRPGGGSGAAPCPAGEMRSNGVS